MLTDRLIILYHHSTSVNLNLFDKFLPATSLSGGIVYISIAQECKSYCYNATCPCWAAWTPKSVVYIPNTNWRVN